MPNLNVDPELVYAQYDQKLAEANKQNVLLSAAVHQLQNELTQVQAEREVLEAENKQLASTQPVDVADSESARPKPTPAKR